jgi:hypothetical protein
MTARKSKDAGKTDLHDAPCKTVTFPASIPPMETAIKIHGEGGCRLQLDIAESDLGAFIPALAMRGKRLSVTLQEAE